MVSTVHLLPQVESVYETRQAIIKQHLSTAGRCLRPGFKPRVKSLDSSARLRWRIGLHAGVVVSKLDPLACSMTIRN